MDIVPIEKNCRGIKSANWAPRRGINRLIGPDDSTKTTILDSIELALSPQTWVFADVKGIVTAFAELLHGIVKTIDRWGLKSRFLRKHLVDVARFYKRISKTGLSSAGGDLVWIKGLGNRSNLREVYPS
jgi:hypothetical protein